MAKVFITNEQTKQEIDNEIEKVIENAINESLKYEECNFDGEVSVTIVDNEEIRELNKMHRDIDRATDVLSFPILEFDENGDVIDSDFDFDGEEVVLGDIVISAERAMEQAEEFGHSFIREMAFLTVHSMLHLLGYDHELGEEEERIMFTKQEEILNIMGILRN